MKRKKVTKRVQKNNGITLIALIVTIIVLLILAGVIIAQIAGNESAPQKAVEARNKNEEGAELDAINVAAISAIAEGNHDLNIDLETLRTSLASLVTETNLETIITGEGPWTVTGKTGKKYLIKNNGNVKSYTATKIKENNTEVELTIDNLKDYIGKTVASVTVNNETVNFGLFYVDFEGKYGEVGTVYLGAKSSIGDFALDGGISNADAQYAAVTIMKQINPDWARESARGNVEYNNYTVAEKGATFLCNPNNPEWAIIGNSFDINELNYVIGAPSVEMFLESYNTKYNSIYSTAYFGAGIKYTYPGYLYSNNEGKKYITSYASELNLEDGMYVNTNKGEWLASPSSHNSGDDHVCFIGQNCYLNNLICVQNYEFHPGVAPLVSLKSGVSLNVVE